MTKELLLALNEVLDIKKGVPFVAAGVAEHAYDPPDEHRATQIKFDAGGA